MNDFLKRKLYRLAIFAVVFGLVWAAERYGLIDGKAHDPTATAGKPTQEQKSATTPEPKSTTTAPPPSASGTKPKPPVATPKGTTAPASPSAADPTKSPTTKPPGTSPKATQFPAASNPFLMKSLSLRDQNGRTIYQGDIDLKPTIERITAGKTLRFPHDGTTFQNRENRLPRQPPGYYREWVVPTPDEDGPGPQRLVTGDGGDVWYTHDHYRTFRRVPTKLEIR